MDEGAAKDMQSFSEQNSDDPAAELEADVCDWVWLGVAVADGKLDTAERDELKHHAPDGVLEKAQRAIPAITLAEAQKFVIDKVADAATKPAAWQMPDVPSPISRQRLPLAKPHFLMVNARILSE